MLGSVEQAVDLVREQPLVLEGEGRFTVGEAQDRLRSGEAIVAPAGTTHGLVNDGPAPLLVLVVVTPPPPHA